MSREVKFTLTLTFGDSKPLDRELVERQVNAMVETAMNDEQGDLTFYVEGHADLIECDVTPA